MILHWFRDESWDHISCEDLVYLKEPLGRTLGIGTKKIVSISVLKTLAKLGAYWFCIYL